MNARRHTAPRRDMRATTTTRRRANRHKIVEKNPEPMHADQFRAPDASDEEGGFELNNGEAAALAILGIFAEQRKPRERKNRIRLFDELKKLSFHLGTQIVRNVVVISQLI